MSRQQATAPERRMGIYNHLDDVPEAHRLDEYADRYDGRDVWAAFQTSRSTEFSSAHYQQTIDKTERTWKQHMRERGRHHALARPTDVETWCADLATDRAITTVYSEYWIRLEEFYTWLQFHTEHPHRYHPVLMAAASEPIAGRVWAAKMATHEASEGTDD